MMTRTKILSLLVTLVGVLATMAAGAEPIELYPGGDKGIFNTRRGAPLEAGEFEGRKATRIGWNAGAATLNELAFRNRPDLLAFSTGIELEIDINTDDFPGLSNAGVRVIDAQGEIHQFGKLKLPEGAGWKTWKINLEPGKITDTWGGGDAGKGEVDPPVKLLSILFNAPGKPEQKRSILIGQIRRSAVDTDAIEPQAVLGGLQMDLQTGQPIRVLFKGDESKFVYRITNSEHGPQIAFRLKLDLTSYQGTQSEWSSEVLTLAPGATTDVPLAKVLPGFGWYQIDPTLEVADGSAKLRRPARHVAYIDPVGTRPLPPEDGFYFGLDSRQRQPEMLKMLSMIGVDILRYGTWGGVNTADGGWRWTIFDEDAKVIRDLGMQVLYSITFTPDYAARPEYEARRKAGDKVGNKPITLSNTPPREDALRDAIKTIIERHQASGFKIYDLWNEPDLQGFWQGTTEEYLEFMRISYETIKSIQPDAVVLTGGIAVMSGHGGHGLNPDMNERIIVDGQDHYDAISVHFHGPFKSFQGQIDGVLAEYRSRLKTDKPLWFTETGYNGDPHDTAQELVKKFSFARARGADGFIWYAMYQPGHRAYNMMDRNADPHPVVPAYNEMVRVMRGKRFEKQHDIGRGNWMLSFTGNNQTLLIGWDEDADAGGRVELVRMPDGAKAKLLDVLGHEHSVVTFENLAFLPILKEVRYLDVSAPGVQLLGSPVILANAPRGAVGQVVPVVAQLQNPLDRPVKVQLVWTRADGSTEKQTVDLAAGERAQASVDQPIPATAAGQAQPEVKVNYQIDGTPIAGQQALRIEAVRLIPAAAIASREADFAMPGRDSIHNPNEADPTRAHLAWGGSDDLSAKVWLALEGDELVVRADVSDDKHAQPHAPADLWQADSVQFAMTVPEHSGVWNIGLARTNDGKNVVHGFATPAGLSGQYDEKIKLTTTPRAGGMVYEARLPLDGFGADAQALRTRGLRFNLLVNDDDGAGRKGFAFIAPGMGRGALTPDDWPGIMFE